MGTPTDARTDQFSFCVALYEALYGERPFAGNTMFALTTAVVQGQVREAPASSKVPLWIRKVLLRGLRPQADDRYPSMQELIEALGKNPNANRRRALVGTVAALIPLALAFGVHQSFANHKSICSAGPTHLMGIWELPGETPGPVVAAVGDPARVLAHRQELRERRFRGREPDPDGLRAELGASIPRSVRGDPGARRAVGGRAGPAHDLPARTVGRPARADRRVQRRQRRRRRERRQRRQQPGRARALRGRAVAAVGAASAGRSGDARAGGRAEPAARPAEGAVRRRPLARRSRARPRAGRGGQEGRVPAAHRGDAGVDGHAVPQGQRRARGRGRADRFVPGGGRVQARRGARAGCDEPGLGGRVPAGAVRRGPALGQERGGRAAAAGRARAAARVAAQQPGRHLRACAATETAPSKRTRRRWR